MGWRVDSELQQMLRESAQGYLGSVGGPAHFRAVRQAATGFDPAAWAAMGDLGWTGILLPEAMDGADLGMESALTLAEELGRAIAPEPFVASAVIAATVLGASPSVRAADIGQRLATGQASVTLAWQEQSGTVGLPEFRTVLADGRLSGSKVFVPAWHEGTELLVAATSPQGPVVVALDPSVAGVTVASARMNDGTFSAELQFRDVVVTEENVLLSGAAAQAALALALARGTVALSAQLEGLAARLWQVTSEYMQQRAQFDTRLSDFQALRHRLVDLYAEIELAAASWRTAADAVAAGDLAGVAVAAAKARCSQAVQDMGRWAIQFHGAFGYTEEADVGLYVHAGLSWSTWLGNPAAQRRAALATRRSFASQSECAA